MPNWKKVIVSGSDAVLGTLIVSGAAAIGTSSLGPYENTLTLGARDTGGEGGQLGFNASGGTYTSASFIDLYQNRLRILKGTNATSTGEAANWSMHNLQMALPAYTGPSSFPGTATATLAVDSSGNVITIAGAGGGTVTSVATAGSVNGITLTGGTITTSGTITLGGTLSNIQSSQLATSSLMIGTTNIALGATGSTLAGLTSITATNFVGTASFVTGSNVFGPYGSNSVVSASYALTASYSPNLIISGSIANVDYIDFNTGSAVPAWKSGRVYWDNTDGALAVYNAEADITLQVGQESWVRVFNEGTTITNGTAVRLVGSHGDVPLIVRAQSQQVSGSALGDNQIIGIATHTIETNSIGYVTTQGLVRGLTTSAFTDGDLLFVSSSAGVLTNVVPQSPYEVIQVGVCVKAGPGGSGIIFVFPTQPIDFGDLASAERGTYQYGDLWSYQQTGSVGVWKHGRSLSGSYSITGSLNVTGGITGSLLGTASYANVAALGGFVQDGNSFGTLATLGTNDNQSLAIETNGTTKMFVSSSGNVGIGTASPTAKLHVAGTTYLSGSAGTVSGSSLTVYGSGSALPVFTVQGSQGELFSITDSLSGSLFSVNDISGLPILEVFSDNTILMGNYQAPSLNTTARTVTTVGSNIIYSIPTASYDGAWFEYTARSGSNARAGQIMGMWSGSLVSFTETTIREFGDTSGLVFTMIVTGSNFALTGSSATAGWAVKTIIRSI